MTNKEQQTKARPFVKWAGGKRQIQDLVKSKIPAFPGTYYEPFLGGGAIFFHLEPSNAILSDVNQGLINVYRQIQSNLKNLVAECDVIEQQFSNSDNKSAYFYSVRDLFNAAKRDSVNSAAMFMFLNKAGFNGIYRENRSGHYNVPFGNKDEVALYDMENLKAVSLALAKVTLLERSFSQILPELVDEHKNKFAPKTGDLVYLDPPYIPLTKTSAFTSYTNNNFGLTAQIDLQNQLRDVISELTRRGVGVVLSNSSAAETFEIYVKSGGMQYEPIDVGRSISASSKGRKQVKELILWNSVIEEWGKNGP